MEIFEQAGWELLVRWIHILAGITWIGLLYYFNFVQGPFFNETEADVKATATRQLVPRALWWFRYAALITWVAGVVLILLIINRSGWENWAEVLTRPGPQGLLILTGATLGTIMFLNVWGVIWPKQKIVIGSAQAAASGGGADPRAAGATRRALLASRTNVLFSIPMVFFMAVSAHPFFVGDMSTADRWLYALIAGALILAIEANALLGTAGPTKKALETVRSVIVSGFVLTAVLYLVYRLLSG